MFSLFWLNLCVFLERETSKRPDFIIILVGWGSVNGVPELFFTRRLNKSDRPDDPRAVEIVERILAEMPDKEREALRRFYLLEEPPRQICRELGLSHAQFLEIKGKTRARFEALRNG